VHTRLTFRETEVLAAMASGMANTAIADSLFISRKAVEKHVNSIFSKLLLTGGDGGQHPRVQAVLFYLTHLQPGAKAGAAADAPRCTPRRSSFRRPSRPARACKRAAAWA
jgi:Bacterial regulatory proteins, luxR family